MIKGTVQNFVVRLHCRGESFIREREHYSQLI